MTTNRRAPDKTIGSRTAKSSESASLLDEDLSAGEGVGRSVPSSLSSVPSGKMKTEAMFEVGLVSPRLFVARIANE